MTLIWWIKSSKQLEFGIGNLFTWLFVKKKMTSITHNRGLSWKKNKSRKKSNPNPKCGKKHSSKRHKVLVGLATTHYRRERLRKVNRNLGCACQFYNILKIWRGKHLASGCISPNIIQSNKPWDFKHYLLEAPKRKLMQLYKFSICTQKLQE